MSPVPDEIAKLMDDYRTQCLWFLRPDYVPRTRDETLRVLELVERYGDRAAYQRCERIKAWLSRPSRPQS